MVNQNEYTNYLCYSLVCCKTRVMANVPAQGVKLRRPHMKKLKAAWIGFMDYGYIRDGGDPFVYFEKYAKMGYKG